MQQSYACSWYAIHIASSCLDLLFLTLVFLLALLTHLKGFFSHYITSEICAIHLIVKILIFEESDWMFYTSPASKHN